MKLGSLVCPDKNAEHVGCDWPHEFLKDNVDLILCLRIVQIICWGKAHTAC